MQEVPEDLFSQFPYKIFIIALLDIIGLDNFPFFISKS